MQYGQQIAQRVKDHHEANLGVSRFEKIPLYLRWAGEKVTHDLVEKFCNLFSEAVFQSVIDANWVPGVYEYLCCNYKEKYFVLVTATPQDEIEKILHVLKIAPFFREVFGAPAKKKDAIRKVLGKQEIMPSKALMIGDTETDLKAAEANLVPFLLRTTHLNRHLQSRYDCLQFNDLGYEQT